MQRLVCVRYVDQLL